MDNPVVIVILTLVGAGIVKLGIILALCGGKMDRVKLAWKSSLKVLRDEEFGEQVQEWLKPKKDDGRPDPTPLRLLNLLQREGRLIDFLMEDLGDATDEQIAAGVREIHTNCRKTLIEHVQLVPIFKQSEGETVDVKAGFDPSAVQLTGNVSGEPPFKGELLHAGWRAEAITLAKPAAGVDELVVQPAEVELPQ